MPRSACRRPPDATEGQDWGLPAYRWDVVAAGRLRLARASARGGARELFDAFRVDHLVGFYRTFIRGRDGGAHVLLAAGRAVADRAGRGLMSLFRAHGSRIIAEDLGVVPDFVRESQARRAVPGLKVLRWEREWEDDGPAVPRSAQRIPPCSVAISGTHDTESMADWWDGADRGRDAGRRRCRSSRRAGVDCRRRTVLGPRPRRAAVGALPRRLRLRAGRAARRLRLARSHQHAVDVSDENWTWRLPWPVEALQRPCLEGDHPGFLPAPPRDAHRRRTGPNPPRVPELKSSRDHYSAPATETAAPLPASASTPTFATSSAGTSIRRPAARSGSNRAKTLELRSAQGRPRLRRPRPLRPLRGRMAARRPGAALGAQGLRRQADLRLRNRRQHRRPEVAHRARGLPHRLRELQRDAAGRRAFRRAPTG